MKRPVPWMVSQVSALATNATAAASRRPVTATRVTRPISPRRRNSQPAWAAVSQQKAATGQTAGVHVKPIMKLPG